MLRDVDVEVGNMLIDETYTGDYGKQTVKPKPKKKPEKNKEPMEKKQAYMSDKGKVVVPFGEDIEVDIDDLDLNF